MQSPKTPGAMTVNTGNLMRRLRAKMEYERAVIRMYENARPQEVIPILDKALEWDVNYFPARIEKAAVFRSLENLMTFPFVRARVDSGELQLHGAYFGVAEGSLFVLDKATKEFRKANELRMANSE